jgi:hypothetical protein
MSRAIEAAALFAVGVITGGVVVYTTRKALPPPSPRPQESQAPTSPTFRQDVVPGEIMSEGHIDSLVIANCRIEEVASIWTSRAGV